jgi:hypothetical protein
MYPLVKIIYKRTLHYDEFPPSSVWGNFHKKKESEERFDEPMYGEKIRISSSTEVAM